MIGPVTLQPNEGTRGGTTIMDSVFSGYSNTGCTGNRHKAITVENDQVRNAVFDSKHTLIGNTFADSDNRVSACAAINDSKDGWVRYVTFEDADGSMSGVGPGRCGCGLRTAKQFTNFRMPKPATSRIFRAGRGRHDKLPRS